MGHRQQPHVTLQQNLKKELSDKSSQAGSWKPECGRLKEELAAAEKKSRGDAKYTPAYVNGLLKFLKKLKATSDFRKGRMIILNRGRLTTRNVSKPHKEKV